MSGAFFLFWELRQQISSQVTNMNLGLWNGTLLITVILNFGWISVSQLFLAKALKKLYTSYRPLSWPFAQQVWPHVWIPTFCRIFCYLCKWSQRSLERKLCSAPLWSRNADPNNCIRVDKPDDFTKVQSIDKVLASKYLEIIQSTKAIVEWLSLVAIYRIQISE